MTNWGTANVTGRASEGQHATGYASSPTDSTVYYHGDHLGTSRLMTSSSGWPIWDGIFASYGEEVNPEAGSNH
jgi:hypothetical protein